MSNRLWRGKKRYAMRLFSRFGADYVRMLRWGLTVKIGDYIGTCEGVNRKVAKIEPWWFDEGMFMRGKRSGTTFLREIMFTDTRGRTHYCPGGYCAYPQETPEQITEFFRNWTSNNGEILRNVYGSTSIADAAIARAEAIKTAISCGLPIVDSHGELLPEFELTHFSQV